jgi:hypothetical protein
MGIIKPKGCCYWLRRSLSENQFLDKIINEAQQEFSQPINVRLVCSHCETPVAGSIKSDPADTLVISWRDDPILGLALLNICI